jgi:tripartite ATP-independent transporter DctM subunit
MTVGIDLLMFAVACIVLLAGYPVAISLAGVALLFAAVGVMFDFFDFTFVSNLPQRIFGTMTNTVLIAVPLFIFMGVMLERSKVAEELLTSMSKLFGTLRGGLGISVTIVGALLAASTGIVGATVVTMGLLSLPTMLRCGYDTSFAAGSICAAGTLGQIIPPSIVLVLLGDVISNAYQKAQLEQMIFAPESVSVGDFFAGALFPGLMLVGFYISYQIAKAIFDPASSPAIPKGELGQDRGQLYKEISSALLPPLILIVAVLGSILGGIATPTEAAAIGALGALFLGGHRQSDRQTPSTNAKRNNSAEPFAIRLAAASLLALVTFTTLFDLRLARDLTSPTEQNAIYGAFVLCAVAAGGVMVSLRRTFESGVLQDVVARTAKITSMVFVILIGAALFSLVFRGLGGDDTIHKILNSMPGGILGAMIVVMAVMFFLGFFLDFIEITFVVVPIVAPVLLKMGVDPVWLGVMMAINLQTSFLTPPFGFALFYLRGVAPPEVRTAQIYQGAIPFVIIQVIALAVLALFPSIATWLPELIYK